MYVTLYFEEIISFIFFSLLEKRLPCNAGDLEAQQHHPDWFIKHKHMLGADREEEVNRLGFFLVVSA